MSDTVSGQAAVELAFVGRKEAAPPLIREAVWTVEYGAVRISFPEPMTPDDVDAVEAYTALWVRGLRRRAQAAAEEVAAQQSPVSGAVSGAEMEPQENS